MLSAQWDGINVARGEIARARPSRRALLTITRTSSGNETRLTNKLHVALPSLIYCHRIKHSPHLSVKGRLFDVKKKSGFCGD